MRVLCKSWDDSSCDDMETQTENEKEEQTGCENLEKKVEDGIHEASKTGHQNTTLLQEVAQEAPSTSAGARSSTVVTEAVDTGEPTAAAKPGDGSLAQGAQDPYENHVNRLRQAVNCFCEALKILHQDKSSLQEVAQEAPSTSAGACSSTVVMEAVDTGEPTAAAKPGDGSLAQGARDGYDNLINRLRQVVDCFCEGLRTAPQDQESVKSRLAALEEIQKDVEKVFKKLLKMADRICEDWRTGSQDRKSETERLAALKEIQKPLEKLITRLHQLVNHFHKGMRISLQDRELERERRREAEEELLARHEERMRRRERERRRADEEAFHALKESVPQFQEAPWTLPRNVVPMMNTEEVEPAEPEPADESESSSESGPAAKCRRTT